MINVKINIYISLSCFNIEIEVIRLVIMFLMLKDKYVLLRWIEKIKNFCVKRYFLE